MNEEKLDFTVFNDIVNAKLRQCLRSVSIGLLAKNNQIAHLDVTGNARSSDNQPRLTVNTPNNLAVRNLKPSPLGIFASAIKLLDCQPSCTIDDLRRASAWREVDKAISCVEVTLREGFWRVKYGEYRLQSIHLIGADGNASKISKGI